MVGIVMEVKIVGVLVENHDDDHVYVQVIAVDEPPVHSHDGYVCVIFVVVMMMLILTQMMVIHCYRYAFVVVFCPDDAMTSLWSWDSSKMVYCTCLTTFRPKFPR